MVRGVFADSSCAVWGGERSQWSDWLHQQGATCDQFGVATSCICSLAKRDFSLWNGLSQTAMSFSRNICHRKQRTWPLHKRVCTPPRTPCRIASTRSGACGVGDGLLKSAMKKISNHYQSRVGWNHRQYWDEILHHSMSLLFNHRAFSLFQVAVVLGSAFRWKGGSCASRRLNIWWTLTSLMTFGWDFWMIRAW